MNIGEKIRVHADDVYIQPDKTVAKATVNVDMKNVGVLFQNASIHETRDDSITLDNVCNLLTAKTYVHIRKADDDTFYGVFIKQADIADFCKEMGLRAIPKKQGCTQYQLNMGKLPKIGSKSFWKWAKYGEVKDLTTWVEKKLTKDVDHDTAHQVAKRKDTGYYERNYNY